MKVEPKKRKIKACVLVGTPMIVDAKLPFRLGDNFVFDRATIKEVGRIQNYLDTLANDFPPVRAFQNNFCLNEDKEDYEGVRFTSTELPSDRWRYYVLRIFDFKMSWPEMESEVFNVLSVACNMAGHDIYIGPIFALRMTFTPDHSGLWEFYTHQAFGAHKMLNIDESFLKDLKACVSRTFQTQNTHPDILHSIKLFSAVPIRVGHNELTTLALFAVLESLMSHNPRGEYDSIGHQIRAKMKLLEKRLHIKVDYAVFNEAPSDTIWKKLYEMRSRIAHGGPLDFEGSLSLLKDAFIVEQFLFKTVKSLLRGAVFEPDLFVDLKAV